MGDTESNHYKMGWPQTIFSFLLAGMGIAMVVVASQFMEEEDCSNGAVTFLFWGGLVTLVANVLGLLGGCSRQLALRDGRISCGESCCLGLLGCLGGMAGLLDFVTLIWGSVVVFGSWPNWTEDDMTSEDYCKATPMLFAFVLQIVRWCLVGIISILGCCFCCWQCSKAMKDSESGHRVPE